MDPPGCKDKHKKLTMQLSPDLCRTMKKSDECCKGQLCLFSDKTKLAIAQSMEKIEEGIVKWRKSVKVLDIMSVERSAQMLQEVQ